MEKVIAVVAVLVLLGCEEPKAPQTPPPPGQEPWRLKEQQDKADAERRGKTEATDPADDPDVLRAALRACAAENRSLQDGGGGLVEVNRAGGAYYLIQYEGKDCGGLPSHIMRIDDGDEWKWLGLTCTTKRDARDVVGFECQGNNDRITARRTGWDRFEGVESRTPSTSPFNQGPLRSSCTGAWGVRATLVRFVAPPTAKPPR